MKAGLQQIPIQGAAPRLAGNREWDGLPMPTRFWAILAVAFGVSLSVIDGAIANVALPTMARMLGISSANSIWIVNAYQLAIVVSLLSFSALGDVIGYRKIYIGGLGIFIVASLGCTLSDSLATLVTARVCQGFGAAAITSVNTTLIRLIYPRRHLGRGMGVNATVVAVSSVAGPTLASGILSIATWPWLFAINIPIGLIACLLSYRFLPKNPVRIRGRHFDWRDGLMNALTFGLLIASIEGYSHGLKPSYIGISVILLVVIACIALVVCFLTDPKREEQTEAAPAETVDVTPVATSDLLDADYPSMQTFADVWLAQATSSQQVEYEVQTESGSETVTDTIHDAQAVSLEQLAELPDLAPGGTLQLWSFQIAVSPEGIDPDTVLLSTERGMSMIDGRAYLLDGSRYLAVCLYGKDRYQILSVQHDTDGTALGSYETLDELPAYLHDFFLDFAHQSSQKALNEDFFTGTDGYGESVTVPAVFTAATESGGGDWGAYIPAEGWLRNLGSRLWYSEKTGASFEVVYYPSVPVSSQIASYDAGGYDGLAMTRCTVYGLGPESAVYLYGAEGGCFEVRIHWDQGENRTDASGYNSYLQSCFEEPLLRKMAMSFYPLNADGTAQKRTMLAQAGGYTLYVRTEATDCPYGDESCHLHTKTSLSCEMADGTEHLLDLGADRTYWFMHYDVGGGFLRVGCLSQDPAHGRRFSTWSLDIFVPELRIGHSSSYSNVTLSGENPAAPETVATDSSMPIQPCELTLPNGVYLGLDYQTTLQLAQAYRGSRVYRGQTPGDNFTVDGVSYYFSADSSGVLRLDSYSVITTELATQSFLRGIKLGDGLQSVLDTIPTADWQPEELYSQLLYGEDLVSGDRAVLDWNSSIYHPSYYTLIIKSGADSANIKFDHDGSVSGIYVSNY